MIDDSAAGARAVRNGVLIGEYLDLETLVQQAATAIIGLWDEDLKTFWRSTEHRAREEGRAKGFFPTVTFTSVEALVRLLREFPHWASPEIKDCVAGSCIPGILHQDISTLKSTLDALDGGELHPITLAHYIQALAGSITVPVASVAASHTAQEGLRNATKMLLDRLEIFAKGSHPFLGFHLFRAFDLSIRVTDWSSDLKEQLRQGIAELMQSSRAILNEILARYQLGLLSPSDAIASGFCAATLAHSKEEQDHEYVLPALEVCFESQEPSGCWPLGRVVSQDKDIKGSRLEISTHEVAWALTEAIRYLGRYKMRNLTSDKQISLIRKLIRAGQYADSTAIRLHDDAPPYFGWCTDYAFGKPIIESWTSAMVLQFGLSLSELLQEANRAMMLSEFSSIDPREPSWPSWLRWNEFREEGEPDEDCRILDYIDKNIIQKILTNPRQLPSPRERSISVLLFGPPGTLKTSIVKGVAEGLQWPVILISPGEFIERGLEYIAAQANSIFSRLRQLSRAVILFDECDELFRKREPVSETEQIRGIAAFVTATMLPKLQELHDHGQSLFFICTNQLESMDNAVKRGGRIDHVIGVGPPDKKARFRIIKEAVDIMAKEGFAGNGVPISDEIISELANATERFTWTELQHAVQMLVHRLGGKNKKDAISEARQVAERMQASLTITPDVFDDFERLKREFSHPHMERRAQK